MRPALPLHFRWPPRRVNRDGLLTRKQVSNASRFFGLASLVAFSRIYLGVHYLGDVLSGSLLGTVLAKIYSRLLHKLGVALKHPKASLALFEGDFSQAAMVED